MTIVKPGFDFQKANHAQENNQDSSSTADMIFSENGYNINKLSNVKILTGTLVIITFLIGFFLISAIYIKTASRCICAYGPPGGSMQESQSSPYFEPLKTLSSDETSKEMRNLPLKIQMHGDAGNLINGNMNGGRVSCEVTRKTASQFIASEPREMQTSFGNISTDPKLLHLTGEKLFFTCYNGEKPKPIVLIARPKIFAIFHRTQDTNPTENDDTSSESNTSSKENNSKSTEIIEENDKDASNKDKNKAIIRNRREVPKEIAECTCNCPIKKN